MFRTEKKKVNEPKHDQLKLVINNAGKGFTTRSKRETGRDSHELRFAFNYFAPFLSAEELFE